MNRVAGTSVRGIDLMSTTPKGLRELGENRTTDWRTALAAADALN